MKFPSVRLLLQNAGQTFVRFPFSLLSAALGTIVCVVLLQDNDFRHEHILVKLLMIAALGLPVFTVFSVFAEKTGRSKSMWFAMHGVVVLVFVAYFFSLPESIEKAPRLHLIRFILLIVGSHFLVAFLPYLDKGEVNGFWHFNKTLFLRFLTSVFYSGVLFVGLVIALQAIEHLFGLKVAEKRYGQLWVVMAGLFNTWFFLAGVPKDFSRLNSAKGYPIGLKVFTQYILLPLVVLYLAILYTYEAKIALSWNWPKGWVAQLVLWFSVTGIFSLLLVHPVKDSKENRWVRTFSTWFFRVLIPLIAMLLLAIFRRISDYGITENRYFVLVQAIALTVVVLYFVFSKSRDIRIIPIILCFLAYFSTFGPWGAFAVSKASQKDRLQTILTEHNILVNGRVQKAPAEVPFADSRNISNIVTYLVDAHGIESIQPWFVNDLQVAKEETTAYDLRQQRLSDIVALMGLSYVDHFQTSPDSSFHFNAEANEPLVISGYDYLVQNVYLGKEGQTPTFKIGRKVLVVSLDLKTASLQLDIQGSIAGSTEIPLEDVMVDLISRYERGVVPSQNLTFSRVVSGHEVKVLITNLSGLIKADGVHLNDLKCRLLVKNRN